MRPVATVVLALLLPLLVPSAAPADDPAAGTGEPHVLAPLEGGVVMQGWTGPVRIDFSDAVPDTYDIWVECPPGEGDGVPPDEYFWEQHYVYDGTNDLDEVAVPALTTPTGGLCGVSAYPSGNATGAQPAFSSFYVAAHRLTFGPLSATTRLLYSRRRDGVLDLTTVGFSVSKPAAVRGRVKDARGRTIRYVNLGRVERDGAWTWRGARRGGFAPVGRYVMELTATDPELGTRRTAAISVRVATAVKTRHSLRRVPGDRMTGSARSGSCAFTRDATAGTAVLRCTGSGHVQAWYRFAVQRSAHAVHGSVGATVGAGRVTRQLQRTGPTSYRVGLRLTGPGDVTIDRAQLGWLWSLHL